VVGTAAFLAPGGSRVVNWTQRILDFPVRAAAVDDFLCELRARGTGDLNAVLATLNEGGLCRQAVEFWTDRGWIVVAPQTPLLALIGPSFDRSVTLRRFCGEPASPYGAESRARAGTEAAVLEEAEEVEEQDADS
jgi:hypothetical protein